MPLITLLPSGQTVDVVEGTSVFAAARSVGIMVETACGGKGTCGLCKVKVVSGAEHLNEMGFEERRFIGNVGSSRLSCRAVPTQPITVEVPPPRPPRPPKKR